MAHTFTETVGIIQGVIAHLKDADNATKLNAAGFSVAARLARLQTKLDKANADNAEQEKRKAALKQQTEILDKSTEDGYVDASGAVDAIAYRIVETQIPNCEQLDHAREQPVHACGDRLPTVKLSFPTGIASVRL